MNERIDWWTHVFDGWKAWLTIYKRRVRAHCPRSCNRKRAINRRERKTLLVAGREVSRLNVRRWCEAAIRETVRSNPDSFSRGGWRNEEKKENLFDRWQSIHSIFRNPKNLRLNASRCVARRSRNSFGRISIGIVLREIRHVRMNLICVTFECRSNKVPLILFNDKKLGRDWRSWIFFFEREQKRESARRTVMIIHNVGWRRLIRRLACRWECMYWAKAPCRRRGEEDPGDLDWSQLASQSRTPPY